MKKRKEKKKRKKKKGEEEVKKNKKKKEEKEKKRKVYLEFLGHEVQDVFQPGVLHGCYVLSVYTIVDVVIIPLKYTYRKESQLYATHIQPFRC